MQRILGIAVVCGCAGLLFSLDFAPSAFLRALAMAAAAVAFVLARSHFRDNDGVRNPAVAGILAALAGFLIVLFPAGKAMTWAVGSRHDLQGVVEGHHRGRRGPCRRKDEIRLVDGDSVTVCGTRLLTGMPVRVNVVSSPFGRYATHASYHVDPALDDILRRAKVAAGRGDAALGQAASARAAAERIDAPPIASSPGKQTDRAASDQAFKDLQAWAVQARAEADRNTEHMRQTTEDLRRASEGR